MDIVPPAELTLHHIGNFDAANGQIFVSHFNDAGGQVIVLDHDGNFLQPVQLQAHQFPGIAQRLPQEFGGRGVGSGVERGFNGC